MKSTNARKPHVDEFLELKAKLMRERDRLSERIRQINDVLTLPSTHEVSAVPIPESVRFQSADTGISDPRMTSKQVQVDAFHSHEPG